MMTVKELIEKLQTLPQDSVVIVSKDDVMDEYGPLSCTSSGIYIAEKAWRGGFFNHDQFDGEDYDYDHDSDKVEMAICLHPSQRSK
jgi:hypothetical protein